MKKYFFVLIGFLLINSAYAYLDESSTCTSSTMNAASGNISLEAVEVPNVINIQWENADGTTYTTSTCTYDTQLQIPNAPAARTGFTFRGWTLETTCSLAELDTSIDGDDDKMACLDLNGNGSCTKAGVTANASLYGLDTAGQWAVPFSYGEVYGEAICSQTSGTVATAGNPDTTGAGTTRYCWFRATGYKEDGGEKCDLSTSSWVFNSDNGSASDCAFNCANKCAGNVRGSSGFRAAVYGATGTKAGDSGGDEKIEEKKKQ